jgi:hypothetical protein
MQTSEWAAKQPHKIIFNSNRARDLRATQNPVPSLWLGNPEPPTYGRCGRFSSPRAASCPRSLAGARLLASAEKRDHRLREIFPSVQIVGYPNILLGKSFAREVRDVELATTGQLGVLPCLFPIVLCPLRPGFHVCAPQLTPKAY